MRTRLLTAVVLIVCAAASGDVRFTSPPTATKVEGGVRIEFAVSAPTDVAVYVEDAGGRVVRHLAAGLLGPNAPAPLKAGSLAQSILWDGRDDAGKPAAGGPFRVRVGAALAASADGAGLFGEYDGANTLTSVIGLAVAPDGRLYVMSNRWKRAWWTATSIHVFRRDGAYEKTIKPFPADLPAERVKAITQLANPDGSPLPVIYRVLTMGYYPKEDIGQQFVVTADGRVHFVVIPAKYQKEAATWLATLDTDGGVPLDTYTGPVLYEESSPGGVNLALSSDGKSVYATGLGRGHRGDERPNVAAVFKIDLATRGPAKVFFGDPAKAGKDATHLDEPRGLCTDGRGTLIVADYFNDRVLKVRESDGELLGELAVAKPDWVGVDPAKGWLYVHSGAAVIKYGVKDGKHVEVARLPLPKVDPKLAGRIQYRFALDAAAEPNVLWVGASSGDDCLLRCEDEGTSFTELKRAGYEPARTFWNMASTQDRRKVSCKVGNATLRILDEDTGKLRDLRLEGSAGQTYRFGPNGQIYGIDHWRWGVRRWDGDGKPLPFPDSLKDPEFKGRLWNAPSGTTSWERDFDVDRAGNVYVKNRGKIYHGRMTVDKYDANGKFVQRVLWVVSDGAQGPRVDPAGNVYIAENLHPHGVGYPAYFDGKLPDVAIDLKGSVQHQYRWMYGSIAKFGPAGGAVWFPKQKEDDVYAFDGEPKLDASLKKELVTITYGDHVKMLDAQLQGALWMHFGVSYVLDMHPGHNRRCHCTATEFEVDDFGRTWYTDQGRFRVVVLDTNGNELAAFGQYGNQDAVGRLAYNWFTGLAVTDRYCYAADGNNRRVVRAKLSYAADATCLVK